MPAPSDRLNLLTDLLAKAKRAGADAADAVLVEGASLSHARRLGKLEKLERAEGKDLGLRVFVGKRQAIVSSSDRSAPALDELVARAVAMAKVAPEDPFCGLADKSELASAVPELDLNDPSEPAPERLVELARAAEETALAVKGITNSEGAEAGWGRTEVALAATNGFAALLRAFLAQRERRRHRRRRHGDGARLRLLLQGAWQRSGVARGDRAQCRGARAQAPQPAQDRNHQGAGRLRHARLGRDAAPPRRRHQRHGDRARHQLPRSRS